MEKNECKKCGYKWNGKPDAKCCPACKTYRWREEKREKK